MPDPVKVTPQAAFASATPTWGSVGQNLIGAGDAYAKFSGSMTASVLKYFFAGAAKYLGNPVSVRLAKLRLAESAFADYQNAQTSLGRLTSLLSAITNTADGLLPGWAADLFNLPLNSLERGVKLGDWMATQLIKLLYPEAFTVTATSSSVGLPDQKTGAVKGTVVFSNPAGGTLTYTFTTPTHGTLTLTETSSTQYAGTVLFTYTPDLAAQLQAELNGAVGIDSFAITATNSVADQSDTVKFKSIPVDPGTPQPGTPSSSQSTPTADGSVNVTIHTTDFPNGTIRYVDPMILPKYGTISNFDGVAGTFTYTPNSDAAGTLSAGTPEQIAATQTTDNNWSVSGRAVFVNTITDSLTVTASNNVHTASQTVAITTELDAPSGVTYAVTSGPANGTITAFDSSTGSYTYTPNAGTTATHDAFTVTATKGGQSASESIAVPVGERTFAGTWAYGDGHFAITKQDGTYELRSLTGYPDPFRMFGLISSAGHTTIWDVPQYVLADSGPGEFSGTLTPQFVTALTRDILAHSSPPYYSDIRDIDVRGTIQATLSGDGRTLTLTTVTTLTWTATIAGETVTEIGAPTFTNEVVYAKL